MNKFVLSALAALITGISAKLCDSSGGAAMSAIAFVISMFCCWFSIGPGITGGGKPAKQIAS